MRKPHDWTAVQRYYDEGHEAAQCRERFGVSYAAWAMAVRRKKLRLKGGSVDGRRRHDWKMVQAYYDQGHSFYECMRVFNFCRGAWHKAKRRGEIKPRPLGRPITELLVVGKSRGNIKLRLLNARMLENRCERCSLSEWLGQPLTVQIDHINGIRDDHRLDNLRMLCPNCHSQTETYGRRNGNRKRLHDTQGAV
jgi:hypothetical protein